MTFDMVRFERGSVWTIRFKNNESNGHEQQKDRPWVVLSANKFNHTSGMITCAPITTRDSTATPAQVLFINNHNSKNIVLCEQIRTFDYRSGNYIFDYAGKLSEEVMNKVDAALLVHLSIASKPMNLERLYDAVETYIKSITPDDKDKAFNDEDVISFAEKLESLAVDRKSIAPTQIKEMMKEGESFYTPSDTSHEEKFSTDNPYYVSPETTQLKSKKVKLPPVDKKEEFMTELLKKEEDILKSITTPGTTVRGVSPKEKNEKKHTTKWTKENCKKFLEDCENLPMKDVMETWGFTKKQRVYSMKGYCQQILEDNPIWKKH